MERRPAWPRYPAEKAQASRPRPEARPRRWALAVIATAALTACSGSEPMGTDGNGDGDCSGPDTLGSCPAWSTFSPALSEQMPAPTDAAPVVEEEAAELERFDDDTGELVNLGNITFVCTTQEYDFVNNPDEALSFNIDETVIWPGALIQGRSHRDASGDGAEALLELPIRERAPVEIAMTFNNERSTDVISNPTPGTVNGAVRTLIGVAEAEGLATANNISFSQETYTSEEQAALAFNVSGRYLAFEGSASGSVSRSVQTSTVAAQLKQQMYIVNVTQPSSPSAFFSEGADAAFAVQADLEAVGPGNPPVYVSRIGYGRMMVFSMSAKAEAEEIKGALSVAYNGIGGSGSANLSAKQQSILSSAEIRLSQIGGDQSNALAAIQSGNLADYFTDVVPLTAAQPIWFELKSLTGEVAMVSEPGTFTQTTCEPKLPGTFDYAPSHSLSIPFTPGTERTTLQADVDGDGQMDLVFNERRTSPALNRVHVALSTGDGTFALQAPWTHSETPAEGWENFSDPLVADLDGDGSSYLVWNALTASNNVIYAARSLGDGSYTEMARQERPGGGWTSYVVRVGDLNGDERDDLLWSNAGSSDSSGGLRTYYALAQDDATFDLSTPRIDRPAGDFTRYTRAPVLAQFDGANGMDFVLNALDTNNTAYIGRFVPTTPTGYTLSFPAPFRATQGGWGDYRLRVGNIDGRNGADLVWVHRSTGRTYRALNQGDGTWQTDTPPFHDNVLANNVPFMADFNNDGRSDLLLISLSADANRLKVGFGLEDGSFTFPAGVQTHPEVPGTGWQTFSDIFVGDVNGDGKADIVWTSAAGDAQVYVAFSK